MEATVYSQLKTDGNKTEKLSVPVAPESYAEIMQEVSIKAGQMPDLPADLPKGGWSDQALKVLRERYLDKDDNGELIETADEMIWRVSWAIASAEVRWGSNRKGVLKRARQFYKLLASQKFLPNSPTLMNAGKGNGLQYSACFVLPVEDSLEGIFDAIKWQAIIHQSGGGTGFGFSRLRPKGSFVKTSRGVASGPVSFMKVFDAATQQIKQGGTRRGANMGMLRIDHPDVRDFITCKLEGGITNFNISVLVTDEFMEALDEDREYALIDPKSGKEVGKESAKEIFELICESAWKSGDPGMGFIDRMNAGTANPVPPLGPVESTNPCGEQPLYGFDACNLGSIFLGYFVTEEGEVDWEGLRAATKLAVRFLDDVIEVNPYPLPQIWNTVRAIRRIGLGVGGWADMLFRMGVAYNSEEAYDLADKVMSFVNEEGHRASEELAAERGAFPLWKDSIYKDGNPLRNSTVTTIAPTGTISILATSGSGIEPAFALAYKHTVKDEHINRELVFMNPVFKEIAQREGFWSDELEQKVADQGSVHGLSEVPEKWQKVFVTSHEIRPSEHVKMQAAWQRSTDNAVSKTINLPNEASVEDVAEAYLQAYREGCMGITVYRDGSKDWQVLNVGSKDAKKTDDKGMVVEEEVQLEAREEDVAEMRIRPAKLRGSTYEVKTPVGTAFVVINEDEMGNPFEVFVNVGKAGTDVTADAEALGRLISLSLRVPSRLSPQSVAQAIVDQLAGIGGASQIGFGTRRVRSLADGIARVLKEHMEGREGEGKQQEDEMGVVQGNGHSNNEVSQMMQDVGGQVVPMVAHQEALPLTKQRRDLCPDCGQATLVIEEGCSKCYNCGASKC